MKICKALMALGLGFVSACGGSGGSSNDVVVEGLLTQGASVTHEVSRLKHGEAEPLEEVKICALGICSTTDGEGQFGFAAPSNFSGGDVLFSVDGHGILAETIVNLPEGKDVFVHLETSHSSEVHLHHVIVDGVRIEAEDFQGAENGHE